MKIDKRIFSEFEEHLYINSTLQELELDITSDIKYKTSFFTDNADFINRVIKEVTKNKSIQKFLLKCDYFFMPSLTDLSLR